MKDMLCVVKKEKGPGNLELTRREIPRYGPNDVLIKVKAAAMCGTDMNIKKWDDWAAKRIVPGVIIGHEFAGEVVAVGELVNSVKPGQIVSAETHIVCNYCDMCRSGYHHVCYNTKTIGVIVDGCFAEYIAIPAENAYVCDLPLPIEVISMMEPLGAAVHAAAEFPLAGKEVAVVGCGPIGIMGAAVAKIMGTSKIIAVEPNKFRGQMALDMGADYLVNPTENDPVETIKSMTKNNRGVDVVLEYSGSIPAMQSALNYCKPEAKIAAAGLPSRNIEFNFSEFVYSGITLKGIAGRLMYITWQQVMGLLDAGLDISPIVTHTLPLEEYEKGFELMESQNCGKVILKMD